MQVGDIFRHAEFYADSATGELLPKYLVILAQTPGGDIVARLLTSKAQGRPENPRCFHGHPYPAYYLGVLGGALGAKSWVDLRRLPDFDEKDFQRQVRAVVLTYTSSVPAEHLRLLLECAAAADDTTQLQERAIRDHLGRMP
jgi:hypothetical protein